METDNQLEHIAQLEQIVREFRFVNDFMPQMVWATQPDGYHDFYNKRWYEFTGLTYQETRDKGWSLVLHPDDYERTWKVWKASLNTGKPYEIEYRMRRHDGFYKWFLARAFPLKDENGKIIKWFGTCTDIQEQRQTLDELSVTKEKLNTANAELRKKNKQLKQINIELDNFVYTASHDLKAPLHNIESLINLLEASVDENPEQQEMLEMIGISLRRFKATMTDLSTIAQSTKEIKSKEEVSLDKLISEIEQDIQEMINSSKASLIRSLEVPGLAYSKKDLRSILFNLITNGIKYCSPERIPQIQIRSRQEDNYVVIEVEDNGSGIKKGDIPKVFQKYSRLHTHIEGTGIGLFILKRMVENANGKIVLRSTEGRGSVFEVYLKVK